MNDCSDSDGKISATNKKRDQDVVTFLLLRPPRSVKKMVVYFTKSDLELESEDDGDKAPKKRSFMKKASTIDSDRLEFELGPDADDEDESIAAYTVPESVSEEEESPGWSILPSTISEKKSEDEDKDSKATPAPTFEKELPCASPHKSETAEVATPAPMRKWKTKRALNVAAPAAVVSVPPPDEVLPTGGVPCASPPVDEDNEHYDRMEESNDDLFGENGEEVDDKDDLDFGDLEFGIVTNLAVK